MITSSSTLKMKKEHDFRGITNVALIVYMGKRCCNTGRPVPRTNGRCLKNKYSKNINPQLLLFSVSHSHDFSLSWLKKSKTSHLTKSIWEIDIFCNTFLGAVFQWQQVQIIQKLFFSEVNSTTAIRQKCTGRNCLKIFYSFNGTVPQKLIIRKRNKKIKH